MISEKIYFRLEKVCLLLAILVLPFDSIPKDWINSFIGGRLSFYFIAFGLTLYCIEGLKYGFKYDGNNRIYAYILVLICLQIISLINGLLKYPFENFLYDFNDHKLNYLIELMPQFSEYIPKTLLVKIYLFVRILKNEILIPGITYYGIVVLIYHIYKKERKNIFFTIRNYIFLFTLVCSLYSVLEIAYLKFNSVFAMNLLKFINPYLYDIAIGHGWWPPLIWENQLRSLCREPSFFGILAAFTIPFLWSFIFEKINIKNFVFLTYFTLLIYLTRARTATLLYFGELFLLYSTFIFADIKKVYKSVAIITLSALLAFTLNVIDYNEITLFFKTSEVVSEQLEFDKSITLEKTEIKIQQEEKIAEQNIDNKNKTENTEEYLKNNVFSVLDKNARSNEARFINLAANLKVFADNPILGVGDGLKNAYIAEILTNEDLKNPEVANWHKTTYEIGPFKSAFPVVNNFANVLVNNGLTGFIIRVLPICYIGKLIIKNYRILIHEYTFIFTFISFCGCIAAMFSNAVWPTYYIALGVLLSVIEFLVKAKSEK